MLRLQCAQAAGPGRIGTAGMVRAITPDNVWMGVGPESAGRVSAMYTGRSTVT